MKDRQKKSRKWVKFLIVFLILLVIAGGAFGLYMYTTPQISLQGDKVMEVTMKSGYEEPGATASFAFHDISPQAPVHVLVIPKDHLSSLDAVTAENSHAIAHVLEAIPTVAKKCGLEKGYRVITNIGEHGCQSVKHLHFHVLGGTQLSENMN